MGICLVGIQDYLPTFVISIFQMLGGMALPLLMLILGGNIYRDFRGKGRVYIIEVVKFVFLKNIVYPLVFIGLLFLLKPNFGVSLIIFLQSAVPPITAVPILTERAGGDRNIARQFVVGSFIFSIVTLPLMVFQHKWDLSLLFLLKSFLLRPVSLQRYILGSTRFDWFLQLKI